MRTGKVKRGDVLYLLAAVAVIAALVLWAVR